MNAQDLSQQELHSLPGVSYGSLPRDTAQASNGADAASEAEARRLNAGRRRCSSSDALSLSVRFAEDTIHSAPADPSLRGISFRHSELQRAQKNTSEGQTSPSRSLEPPSPVSGSPSRWSVSRRTSRSGSGRSSSLRLAVSSPHAASAAGSEHRRARRDALREALNSAPASLGGGAGRRMRDGRRAATQHNWQAPAAAAGPRSTMPRAPQAAALAPAPAANIDLAGRCWSGHSVTDEDGGYGALDDGGAGPPRTPGSAGSGFTAFEDDGNADAEPVGSMVLPGSLPDAAPDLQAVAEVRWHAQFDTVSGWNSPRVFLLWHPFWYFQLSRPSSCIPCGHLQTLPFLSTVQRLFLAVSGGVCTWTPGFTPGAGCTVYQQWRCVRFPACKPVAAGRAGARRLLRGG